MKHFTEKTFWEHRVRRWKGSKKGLVWSGVSPLSCLDLRAWGPFSYAPLPLPSNKAQNTSHHIPDCMHALMPWTYRNMANTWSSISSIALCPSIFCCCSCCWLARYKTVMLSRPMPRHESGNTLKKKCSPLNKVNAFEISNHPSTHTHTNTHTPCSCAHSPKKTLQTHTILIHNTTPHNRPTQRIKHNNTRACTLPSHTLSHSLLDFLDCFHNWVYSPQASRSGRSLQNCLTLASMLHTCVVAFRVFLLALDTISTTFTILSCVYVHA